MLFTAYVRISVSMSCINSNAMSSLYSAMGRMSSSYLPGNVSKAIRQPFAPGIQGPLNADLYGAGINQRLPIGKFDPDNQFHEAKHPNVIP